MKLESIKYVATELVIKLMLKEIVMKITNKIYLFRRHLLEFRLN